MSVDTICALATAPGGAIGIVRISGNETLEILSRVFTKDLTNAQPNTIHYGHIRNGEEIVDEVLVSVFRAPTLTRAKRAQRFRVTVHVIS